MLEHVNWVLLLVAMIILGYTLWGWARGMIRMLMAVCSLLVSIFASLLLAPHVNDFICEYTDWDTRLEEQCRQAVGGWMDEQEQQAADQADQTQQNSVAQYIEDTFGITLPDAIAEGLGDAQQSTEDVVANLQQSLAKSMAANLLSLFSYLGTFFALMIVLRILLHLLDLVAKLPVIHGMNHAAGLILGFVQGVFLVWMIFAAISFFQQTEFGMICSAQIEANQFLTFMYDNNVFLQILKTAFLGH